MTPEQAIIAFAKGLMLAVIEPEKPRPAPKKMPQRRPRRRTVNARQLPLIDTETVEAARSPDGEELAPLVRAIIESAETGKPFTEEQREQMEAVLRGTNPPGTYVPEEMEGKQPWLTNTV